MPDVFQQSIQFAWWRNYDHWWLLFFIFLQYVGDEEFGETIKSYSSVKKEQTMFTDTHL